eukprot:CAMPEP_0182567362 /NCGR_PEP_ID=MMETSP1324-20130603/8601_1 /TAXON_ID=236786 /ORGANISM="Florenciella sp., Strain RCC1587" /LENGTH=495 /DNA_ID=CAMNT_0024781337 /DNA_START=175 /DNA_END=1658 /DNA_ORIENTATION=-
MPAKKKKLVIRSTHKSRSAAHLAEPVGGTASRDDGDGDGDGDGEEEENDENEEQLDLAGSHRIMTFVRGPKDKTLPVPELTDTMDWYKKQLRGVRLLPRTVWFEWSSATMCLDIYDLAAKAVFHFKSGKKKSMNLTDTDEIIRLSKKAVKVDKPATILTIPISAAVHLTIDGSKSAAGEDGKWCWSIHDGLRTLPLFADDGEKRDRWMGALAKYAGAVGVNLARCSKEHALFPCNACSNMVTLSGMTGVGDEVMGTYAIKQGDESDHPFIRHRRRKARRQKCPPSCFCSGGDGQDDEQDHGLAEVDEEEEGRLRYVKVITAEGEVVTRRTRVHRAHILFRSRAGWWKVGAGDESSKRVLRWSDLALNAGPDEEAAISSNLQYNLGCCYAKGTHGVEQSFAKAKYWFGKAAAQTTGFGFQKAAKALANSDVAGAEEEEYEEDPYAMYILGTYYAKGQSVEKDLILARSFFARSGVLVEKAQSAINQVSPMIDDSKA